MSGDDRLQVPASGSHRSLQQVRMARARGMGTPRRHDGPMQARHSRMSDARPSVVARRRAVGVELDGEPQFDEHKIVAPAGALRSQIDGWTATCAHEYGEACAWRARDRASEALIRAGHSRAAAQLAACTTLDDLLVTARRLADDVPDTRISLTIAGDGAARALTGAPPTSAYIAAHAALRLDGPRGYAAERAWQSQWLVQRLGLSSEA
jgi:hypothetical protein